MYAVAYRRTMAGAKPKFRSLMPPPEPSKPEYVSATERAERIWRERELERQKNEAMKAAVEKYRCITIIPVSVDNIDRLEMRTCRVFKVTRMDLRPGSGRDRKTVMAKQFLTYWTARLTTHSAQKMGRLMGGFDQATIVHSYRVYPEKRAKMGRYLREAR